MKKGLKITLITLGSLVGLVLLILLLVLLLAGPIAKSYVNKHGEELVGRRMSVEKVKINPFSGHLAIHDLDIYEEDKQTSFAGFDTLDVSLRLLKLLGKEVYVNHITLAGLNVRVEQNGTDFNFSSMLDHFQSDDTIAQVKDTTPSGWIINLHQIRLRDGNIAYNDLPRGSHWGLSHLDLLVPDFCIGGKESTTGGLSLTLDDGGRLNADLDYNAVSNDFTLSLALDQFSLNQAQPYLTDFANIDKLGGRLNIHANVAGNLDQIMQMNIAGDLSVEGLDVLDNRQHSVASLGSLAVNIRAINLADNRYDIASVVFDGLKTEYHTYTDHNSFSHLLKEQKTAETKPSTKQSDETTQNTVKEEPKQTEAAKPMQLTLGLFELKNSHVTYADHTLPEEFVFPVKDINIKAENVSLSGENNAMVRASLPGGGHAMIRWNGNISDWKKKQHLNLRIKNLHLTELNPYMLAYLGQPFKDGTFSFTSDNRITNSELNGKNNVDIYKASVDKRRKDVDAQMHLPLKAALYILKDKDDKILLDVPISGNIDKPEFSYMKLVWKTLGNLMVKVVTSPVRALGDVFKSDSDGNVILPIADATVPDFTSEQYYEIDRVAEMAKEDESILISFDQQLPASADSLATLTADRRNRMLRHHLQQLGLDTLQTSVGLSQQESLQQPQYLIKTSIKEEE